LFCTQEDKNSGLLQSDVRTENILCSMPNHFKNVAPGGCVITATTDEVWQVLDRSIPDGKYFFKQSPTASGYELASAMTFQKFEEVLLRLLCARACCFGAYLKRSSQPKHFAPHPLARAGLPAKTTTPAPANQI
jgi:hypothetical protein